MVPSILSVDLQRLLSDPEAKNSFKSYIEQNYRSSKNNFLTVLTLYITSVFGKNTLQPSFSYDLTMNDSTPSHSKTTLDIDISDSDSKNEISLLFKFFKNLDELLEIRFNFSENILVDPIYSVSSFMQSGEQVQITYSEIFKRNKFNLSFIDQLDIFFNLTLNSNLTIDSYFSYLNNFYDLKLSDTVSLNLQGQTINDVGNVWLVGA